MASIKTTVILVDRTWWIDYKAYKDGTVSWQGYDIIILGVEIPGKLAPFGEKESGVLLRQFTVSQINENDGENA